MANDKVKTAKSNTKADAEKSVTSATFETQIEFIVRALKTQPMIRAQIEYRESLRDYAIRMLSRSCFKDRQPLGILFGQRRGDLEDDSDLVM